MKSYLCMTGHFFLGEQFKSTVLAFNIFKQRHTSDNISQIIQEQFRKLKIEQKVSTITCDDASNMKRAFDSLSTQRIQCFAHKLHLVICNALGLWAKTPIIEQSTKPTAATAADASDDDDFDGDKVCVLRKLGKHIFTTYLLQDFE